MPLLDLDQIKLQLRIEIEDSEQDVYLRALGDAAQRACELRTGRYVDPASAPADSEAEPFSDADLGLLRQAALILAAEWYQNREATASAAGIIELPLAVSWMLDPLKDFADR